MEQKEAVKKDVEKTDTSSDTMKPKESARIMSLLEPAHPRRQGGGRGRKPTPKKVLFNFLSGSDEDSDDPPYHPVVGKKNTPVKARKKRDMFDEVIISESEDVDKEAIDDVISKTLKTAKQSTLTKRGRGRPMNTAEAKKTLEIKKSHLPTVLVPCGLPPRAHLQAPGGKGVVTSLSRPKAASTPTCANANPLIYGQAGEKESDDTVDSNRNTLDLKVRVKWIL